MAATTVYTSSMHAKAEQLVSESAGWVRGRRKSDSLAFVIFPSSKPGRSYYSSERGCTCPGWTHRLACSHVLAIRIEAAEAREAFATPRKGYADLFPRDDLDEAF